MKRTYSNEYYPPVPVLQVRFGILESGLYTEDKVGIVDTGADATIVPTDLLDQIEASVDGYNTVHGQWGGSRDINQYIVDVIVEGISLPGIWVIGDNVGDEIILGRDVLNRLRLVLDGLKSQIEVIGY